MTILRFRVVQLLLLCLASTHALDIILKDFECNQSLPIYVQEQTLALSCNGTDHCAMGSEALITGKLQYTGVEDLGLQDGFAFVSADLEFLSLDYDLLQYLQVPICGQYVLPEGYDADAAAAEEANDGDDANANDDNGCPENGAYTINLPYVLPDPQTKASWLATGWKGTGQVSFYSEANNADSLMGSCQLYFATDVTKLTEDTLLAKIPIPSAKVTFFIVAAFVSFLLLTCFYRMFIDIASGKKKKEQKRLDEESCAPTSDFVSMKD